MTTNIAMTTATAAAAGKTAVHHVNVRFQRRKPIANAFLP